MFSYLTAHYTAFRGRLRQSRVPGMELIEYALVLMLIVAVALAVWTHKDKITGWFENLINRVSNKNPAK